PDPLTKPDPLDAAQPTDHRDERELRHLDRARARWRDQPLVAHADQRHRPATLEANVLAQQHRLQLHRSHRRYTTYGSNSAGTNTPYSARAVRRRGDQLRGSDPPYTKRALSSASGCTTRSA